MAWMELIIAGSVLGLACWQLYSVDRLIRQRQKRESEQEGADS